MPVIFVIGSPGRYGLPGDMRQHIGFRFVYRTRRLSCAALRVHPVLSLRRRPPGGNWETATLLTKWSQLHGSTRGADHSVAGGHGGHPEV